MPRDGAPPGVGAAVLLVQLCSPSFATPVEKEEDARRG